MMMLPDLEMGHFPYKKSIEQTKAAADSNKGQKSEGW